VSVDIELDIREVPRVLADLASIHQVVTNLGTNAAHAMPAGGRLEIVLEPFYVRDSFARANPELHEGEYAVLTVRDTGHGMDAATRARVFEPFFTTKAPGSGTGLGLAMVHGIMKEHHGAVLLTSETGQGTTVRCFFPSLLEEVRAGADTRTHAPRGRGQHVLFVDDEPGLARIGSRRLALLGYHVTLASNGKEALERFHADSSIEVVITDFTMPGMNGLELARELTRLRPDLPVIMTTGYIDEFPPDAISEAGVRRLVMKPVSMDDLGLVVAEALTRVSTG
jgi:CheY-like chemotaxis protein